MQLFLAKRVAEGLKVGKLANRVGIELVNACERLVPYSLLVVGKEQSSELLPLEEVFAVVLGLGHRKHVLMHIRLVFARRVELKPDARSAGVRHIQIID